MKTFYLVYNGRGRGRDGKFYRRTFVKKLVFPSKLVVRPKILKIYKDKFTENVIVEIGWMGRHKYRGGVTYPREHFKTVVLGETARDIKLTTRPPKGPKIDRK